MSQDVFITSIHVKRVRNIENFDIPLDKEKRQHLIFTGKNGSGKTSLLLEMDKFISQTSLDRFNTYAENIEQLKIANLNLQKSQESENLENTALFKNRVKIFTTSLANYGETEIYFKNVHLLDKNYLIILFEAKRFNDPQKPITPKGISKVEFKSEYKSTDRVNPYFVQYIVNLKADRSFARDENEHEAVKQIDIWFERFENQLKNIFDAPDLRLLFDRKNYNFHIQIGNNEPFAFNELSDGYSAVISIVAELILRMEAVGNKAYNQQGIVLIDEIETHLHVALQKKIMPFLCNFFPNVQFIVTTHSPFVLSSISDAVICDLETKEVITDLSGYSYTALVESYFDTDKYSQEIKNKIARFEDLSTKNILNEQEEDERYELKRYFDDLPKFHADELAVKVQQIKLQTMARKG